MRKNLIPFIILWLTGVCAMAQAPNLDVKEKLSTTLRSTPKVFSNPNTVDTIEIPLDYIGNFTLEVKGKVNSAEGRGLDIEARRMDKMGFRTSVTANKFNWTSSLKNLSTLSMSSADEQVFRYAVEKNTVHIYQNGTYIDSQPLSVIYDIKNDEEIDPTGEMSSENLISNIFGKVGDKIKPIDTGWGNNGSTSVPWQAANAGSGVRFQDNFNGLTYNGVAYTDRALLLRWESGVTNGSNYYYPVTLAANTTYNFSFLYGYWNNGSTGGITFGVSQENTGKNIINETTLYDWDRQTFAKGDLTFTTAEAGTYYLLVSSSTAGIWVLGDMNVRKFSVDPRIVIGKNYMNGAVDMSISSVTYDATGAYAPLKSTGPVLQYPVTITDEKFDIAAFINNKVTIQGESEVHVTSTDPLRNSVVDIQNLDSWLYFDGIRPSKVKSDLLQYVTIKGQPVGENDRIAIYGSGTVIIPDGKLIAKEAITVYTEPNFGGTSKTFEINTYHNQLGDLDNKIQSFKLKKGFSATLANNPDGTGFSRVFIASDEDLEVSVLPEGMEGFVSFVRVFKWEWTSKKGWAGGVGSNALTEAAPSISYDWDAAGNTENIDTEYVPMRHNLGWQSFDIINSRNNVSHVLGYNEPERPDQSNMTVDQAIAQWPELLKSGLRLGSPVPSSTPHSWLNNFMAICDTLNYRVDFVVTHAYQYQPTSWWTWMVDATSTAADGRPVWITEWNNGANWTTESWPDATGAKRDADLNIILDENGQETIVNKPLSPANAARQETKLMEIMSHMENMGKLEHHFLYNWVQDARALELNGKLTPAGKVFATFKSQVGFKKANEYVHKWKIAPPWIATSVSDDYKSITLSWKDNNGETGVNYILERKLSTESDYTVVATFEAGKDYTIAGNIAHTERLAFNSASFRVKATSYKGTESIYSRAIQIKRDADAAPPTLKGEAMSSSKIKIHWTPSVNARSYNVKRSSSVNGTYETIAEFYQDTLYIDENLNKSTTYFYKISCLNTSGEGVDSKPIDITTRSIEIPTALSNFYVASGDASAILTWDFAYDVKYTIYRSNAEDGTYTVITSNFEGIRYIDKGLVNGETYYYKVIGKNTAGESPESEKLSAQPGNGQHLHISFNENDGAVAFDEWGGYHGTLEDGAEWIAAEDGSGVSLSTVNKSYIKLKDNVVADLSDFTVASWLKLPANQGNNTRMFDFGNGTGVFMVFIPKLNSTEAKYKITCLAGMYEAYIPYVMPTEEWVHVAITQEGKVFKTYINGELIYTGENTKEIKPSDMGATPSNYLGRSQWPNDPYCAHSYDDFSIYNFALSAKNIEKLANRQSLPKADDVKLHQLTVNGEVWNIKDRYIIGCGNNPDELVLEIEADADISVIFKGEVAVGNQIVIGNLGNISTKEIEFSLLSDDGREASFAFTVERYLDFSNVVIQRWNNTLLVNNNSATNGGYSFKGYGWFKDGVKVGTTQYYSAGRKGSDLLDVDAVYQLQLTTTDGNILNTCPTSIVLKKSDVKIYPNPVAAGQSINIELDMDADMIKDASVDVYDVAGNCVINKKLDSSSVANLNAPNASGVYVVKVKSNSFSKEVKIIVK